jgi:hypothetical protein
MKCHIQITMPDGSKGVHIGIYPCTVDAVLYAMEAFPEAQRISVKADSNTTPRSAV